MTVVSFNIIILLYFKILYKHACQLRFIIIDKLNSTFIQAFFFFFLHYACTFFVSNDVNMHHTEWQSCVKFIVYARGTMRSRISRTNG